MLSLSVMSLISGLTVRDNGPTRRVMRDVWDSAVPHVVWDRVSLTPTTRGSREVASGGTTRVPLARLSALSFRTVCLCQRSRQTPTRPHACRRGQQRRRIACRARVSTAVCRRSLAPPGV
jgi:hypothetical protein